MSKTDNIQSGLDCFKNFKCVASRCTDNCCIGWEIDIDDDALEYYNAIDGELGDKIRAGITYGDCNCFKMDKDERCVFLNSDNLCDIIIALGEDKIPYICTHHPRFYEWLYDRCEMGYGICCPEAARLLYKSDKKIAVDVSYIPTDNLSDVMTYAREVAFSVLQNRKLSLADRLVCFLKYCEELDDYLYAQDVEEILYIVQKYKISYQTDATNYEKTDLTDVLIDIFSSLEPVDDEWTRYINQMKLDGEKIFKDRERFFLNFGGREWEYEHLSVYLTYRYFLKCLDDMDIISIGRLIVICVLFNILMDIYSHMRTDKYDRIENSVVFSKEVEYSEINIDMIYDARALNCEKIKGYINLIYNS